MNEPTHTFGPCTLYTRGVFGMTRTDCRELRVIYGQYAQYTNIPAVYFTEKGKRNQRGLWITPSSLAVVLDQAHAVDVADPFEDSSNGGRRSRYGSFATEYTEEFRAQIAGKPVLWDSEQRSE
jgi:hypothetical protein